MRLLLFIALFFPFCMGATAQSSGNALYIEYGYPNIPERDPQLMSGYGYARYRVYADDRFISVENAQVLPEGENQGLRSGFIQDRQGGEVYLCVEVGQERFRKRTNAQETEMFHDLTTRMPKGMMNLIGTNKTERILGHDCLQYWLIPEGQTDTMVVYLNNRLVPASGVRNFPMAVHQGGEFHGVVLGRDDKTDKGQVIPFRALSIDINKPKDIAAVLAGYRTVSEEEGNTILQRWITSGMETDRQ